MKKVPLFDKPIPQYKFQLTDFLGVDFTTHESEVNTRRSPDSVNMISGQTGSMDKRLGTKIEHQYIGKINSISTVNFSYRRYEEYYWYNESTGSWNLGERYYNVSNQYIIVHAGLSLHLGKMVNGVYTHIENIFGLSSATGNTAPTIENTPTKLMRLNQFTYLLTGAGTSVIIDFLRGDNINKFKGGFGLEADASVGGLGWDGSIPSGDNQSFPSFQAYILDIRYLPMAQSKFKIPVINIACKPNGTSRTPFESKNIFNGFVSEKFIGDGTSVIFKLSEQVITRSTDKDTKGFTLPFYNATTDCCVRIRIKDASGNWVAYGGTYTRTDSFTLTLSTAPSAPTIAGDDNVEITYLRYIAQQNLDLPEWKSVRLLSRLTNFEYYGYNGSFDFAFVQYGYDGDFGKLNMDYRIRLSDLNEEITMPEDSYSYLGDSSSKILGYFRMNNELVTVTKKTSNNPTIFIRSASLDDNGVAIFPIRVGVVGVGSIEGNTFASLRDDPLWVSEYGVNALITNNITNVQSVQDRGFYINNQLLKEASLNNAIAFVYANKYFLCINSHIYVADSRMKYGEKLSYSESFQYDWFYWDGISITAQVEVDGKCYFGTPNGLICRFKNVDDEHAYEDEIIGTETTWADATPYTLGQLVKDSGTPTKYYICIKPHTSSSIRNLLNETYWNEITKGVDRFYVPVLAYWCTPILNMQDITTLKSLKNLWVRMAKYSSTGARIYYSTKGIVKKQYDGIFDFSDIDFSRFTFSTDTDPMIIVTNVKESKFKSIQFKIESRDNTPMSLLEIVGKYTINNQYKG